MIVSVEQRPGWTDGTSYNPSYDPHLLQVTCSAKAPKDVKHSTDALTEAADRSGHAFACALAQSQDPTYLGWWLGADGFHPRT